MLFAPACVCAAATGPGETPPYAVGAAVCRPPGGYSHSAMARSGRRNDLLPLFTCIGPSLDCLGLGPIRCEHDRRDQLHCGSRRGRVTSSLTALACVAARTSSHATTLGSKTSHPGARYATAERGSDPHRSLLRSQGGGPSESRPRYPVSFSTRMPCRSVIRAAGQRATAAR